MTDKIKTVFFPPVDASQAMSNWIEKPDQWLKSLEKSPKTVSKLVCALDSVIIPLARGIIGSFAAALDCYYQGTWCVLKLAVMTTKSAVQVVTFDKYGKFCEKVSYKEVGTHFVKCLEYFVAIFGAPITEMLVFVRIADKEHLVKTYRQRDLIVGSKTKFEAVLDQVHEAGEFTLSQIKQGKQVILNRISEGKEFVLSHPVKAGIGGAVALTALSGLNVTLQQLGHPQNL